jgi:sugar phosphate isomerase/epimerase
MRLGAPIFEKYTDPAQWAAIPKKLGYRAAYCPFHDINNTDLIAAYEKEAKASDLVIAEVGAWSNPLSPDPAEARKALALNQERLALADKIGARCCVNIAGSRGANWAGPHPQNFTDETFAMIVDTVRKIIDAVKPTRTFYTLETMPCMYPDDVDCYVHLMKAIDRKRFAAHFDATNLICSPQRYHTNAAIIKEFTSKLGPHIRSAHAKDVTLLQDAIAHLNEIRPGLGALDYRTLLRELNKLDKDTPLMVEHLPNAEEYSKAVAYIRATAKEVNVPGA